MRADAPKLHLMPHLFSPIGLFWWMLGSSAVFVAKGQTVDCETAKALALNTLGQYRDTCVADLSACVPLTSCLDECLDGGDSVSTVCTDACPYTYGGYTVEREVGASYGLSNLPDAAVPIITLSFFYKFTAGAQGTLRYTYKGTIAKDSRTIPELRGTCTFSFNEVDCICIQRWCDADETVYAHQIDCSGLEGGAVLDMCTGIMPSNSLSNSLSLMEILFWVPDAVCEGPTMDGSGSTAPPADNAGEDTGTEAPQASFPDSNKGPLSSAGILDKDLSRWVLLAVMLLASIL